MGKFIDLTGRVFERLEVIGKACRKNRQWYWKCKCSCGKVITTNGNGLRQGKTLSCGCYARDKNRLRLTKHGLYKHPLHIVWGNMISRCYYPKNIGYRNYGGRGITVCDEWRNDFYSFHLWATSNGYKKSLTIDRIDNNKGYNPDNCRWVNQKEQCNNKNSNHTLTYSGITKTISQWSDELNIKVVTIQDRIHRGWSDERIITTPLQKSPKEKALLTYNGRTETPVVWSRLTGIDRGTIRYRKSIGWTDEEVLTIPIHYRKDIEKWREEHL